MPDEKDILQRLVPRFPLWRRNLPPVGGSRGRHLSRYVSFSSFQPTIQFCVEQTHYRGEVLRLTLCVQFASVGQGQAPLRWRSSSPRDPRYCRWRSTLLRRTHSVCTRYNLKFRLPFFGQDSTSARPLRSATSSHCTTLSSITSSAS